MENLAKKLLDSFEKNNAVFSKSAKSAIGLLSGIVFLLIVLILLGVVK